MVADQVAHVAHLNARDTTLMFVSRAPQADIGRLKARMGWTMPWYSLMDSFDADLGVDEWHGTTPSSATATACSAPTSSTTAATRRWAAPGAISTSQRSGARRSGRTRRKATRRRRPTNGGTGTTTTGPRRHRTRNGSRSPTPERPPSGTSIHPPRHERDCYCRIRAKPFLVGGAEFLARLPGSRNSTTKAGNGAARRMLIEAAWLVVDTRVLLAVTVPPDMPSFGCVPCGLVISRAYCVQQAGAEFLCSRVELFSSAAAGHGRRHDHQTTVDHALMRGLVTAGPVMRRGARRHRRRSPPPGRDCR